MVERASSLLAGLTAECSRQRHQLTALRTELSAERDEARQEVVNAEAMFADLHRFVAVFSHSCHTASQRESVKQEQHNWWTDDSYLQCCLHYL